MRLLEERVAPGSLVFVVGGEGIVTELEKRGYRVTRSADDAPDAVVQGFAPDVGWRELAEAAFALNAHGGRTPGRASRGSRRTWTGRSRSRAASRRATARSCPRCTPRSDGSRRSRASPRRRSSRRPATVRRASIRSWSATGSTPTSSARTARAWPGGGAHRHRPGQAGAGCGCREPTRLHPRRPARAARAVPGRRAVRGGAVRVGTAAVRVDGRRVVIVSDGDRGLDLLRAACAAIWQSGTAIHALDVAERLYAEPPRGSSPSASVGGVAWAG